MVWLLYLRYPWFWLVKVYIGTFCENQIGTGRKRILPGWSGPFFTQYLHIGMPAFYTFLIHYLNEVVCTDNKWRMCKRSQYGRGKIDLIVRGICCLRPHVKGLTENFHCISRFHDPKYCKKSGDCNSYLWQIHPEEITTDVSDHADGRRERKRAGQTD